MSKPGGKTERAFTLSLAEERRGSATRLSRREGEGWWENGPRRLQVLCEGRVPRAACRRRVGREVRRQRPVEHARDAWSAKQRVKGGVSESAPTGAARAKRRGR